MKSKQHEYILKAFLNSSIPAVIRRSSPELMVIDSVIGGYCSQLIKRAKLISLQSSEIISKTEKAAFSELINQSTGMEKDELVVYYRLAILVESILIQYMGTAYTEKQRLKKNEMPDVHVICKREEEIIENE